MKLQLLIDVLRCDSKVFEYDGDSFKNSSKAIIHQVKERNL